MKKKQEKISEKPKVHQDLDGFEISIDAFGKLSSNLEVDELNKFLNKNVDDKKLRDRDDLEDLKE